MPNHASGEQQQGELPCSMQHELGQIAQGRFLRKVVLSGLSWEAGSDRRKGDREVTAGQEVAQRETTAAEG